APNIGATRPFSGSPGSLTCPDDPEQKTKCQGQTQRRIGPLLQGLVDRVGHVVADFADRLDCFPSLVLGVRDDTADIRTCRHGSILSYGIIAVKPNVDIKVPAIRHAAEDASLCGHRPALQRRTILSSFGQRADCDRRGGRTTHPRSSAMTAAAYGLRLTATWT